jgi:hypothetical protein
MMPIDKKSGPVDTFGRPIHIGDWVAVIWKGPYRSNDFKHGQVLDLGYGKVPGQDLGDWRGHYMIYKAVQNSKPVAIQLGKGCSVVNLSTNDTRDLQKIHVAHDPEPPKQKQMPLKLPVGRPHFVKPRD